jgi:hypothetical protein
LKLVSIYLYHNQAVWGNKFFSGAILRWAWRKAAYIAEAERVGDSLI